jgi:multicomponent Na+:H+ antiporter subunit D
MSLDLTLFPVLLPLFTAALCILCWRRPALQDRFSLVGAALLLAASIALTVKVVTDGPQRLLFSGWIEPFAIGFVADVLGTLLVTVSGLVGLAAIITEKSERSGGASPATAPFVHVLLAGVNGAFLTGDLFNLYVWFEVLLIASFVLLVVDGGRRRLQGAFQYVILNLLGSIVFLSAVGLVYGMTKSLNMAVVAERMLDAGKQSPEMVQAVAGLFLVAFALKAGVFPLFYWLPVSYPGLPASLGALFAGLLTKVGVYALLRIFTLVVPPGVPGVFPLLLVGSALTMVIGVLAAVSRGEIRSILSFHILSQIGYMIVGIGLVGSGEPRLQELGVAATVFYIVHHILVKANLFLVGGAVSASTGASLLSRTGGLMRAKPVLAALFLIPALSLAGVPPLSGFWAKLTVLRAGLEAGETLVVACALVAGLFTLLSMVKIWNEAFWKPAPAATSGEAANTPNRSLRRRLIPIAGLAALTVAIGAYPQPLLRLAERSAQELLAHRNGGERVEAIPETPALQEEIR